MSSRPGMQRPPVRANPYEPDLFAEPIVLDGSEPDPTSAVDRQIWEAHKAFGEHGAALFEIERKLPHINPKTISAQTTYLTKRWGKLVRTSGRRRNPRTGKMCDVRIAVPEARRPAQRGDDGAR